MRSSIVSLFIPNTPFHIRNGVAMQRMRIDCSAKNDNRMPGNSVLLCSKAIVLKLAEASADALSKPDRQSEITMLFKELLYNNFIKQPGRKFYATPGRFGKLPQPVRNSSYQLNHPSNTSTNGDCPQQGAPAGPGKRHRSDCLRAQFLRSILFRPVVQAVDQPNAHRIQKRLYADLSG
jgi:hypothetical protein